MIIFQRIILYYLYYNRKIGYDPYPISEFKMKNVSMGAMEIHT